MLKSDIQKTDKRTAGPMQTPPNAAQAGTKKQASLHTT